MVSGNGLPQSPSPGTAPGWLTDPLRPNEQLYWDGQQWVARRKWSPTGYVDSPLVPADALQRPVFPPTEYPPVKGTVKALFALTAAGAAALVVAIVLVANHRHHHKSPVALATGGVTSAPVTSFSLNLPTPSISSGPPLTSYGELPQLLVQKVRACVTPLATPTTQLSSSPQVWLQETCRYNGAGIAVDAFRDKPSELSFIAVMEQQHRNYAAGPGWVASNTEASTPIQAQLSAGRSFVDVLGGSFYEIDRPVDQIAASLARDDGAIDVPSYYEWFTHDLVECRSETAPHLAAVIDASLLVSSLSGETGHDRLMLMVQLAVLLKAANGGANCQALLSNYVASH